MYYCFSDCEKSHILYKMDKMCQGVFTLSGSEIHKAMSMSMLLNWYEIYSIYSHVRAFCTEWLKPLAFTVPFDLWINLYTTSKNDSWDVTFASTVAICSTYMVILIGQFGCGRANTTDRRPCIGLYEIKIIYEGYIRYVTDKWIDQFCTE